MKALTLAFAPPEHGWMVVTLGRPEGDARQVDASDVPCDSLTLLVSAMHALLTGAAACEMEWSLEPSYEVWRFVAEASDDLVRVEVGIPPAKLETFARVPRRELVTTVWRALRRLESDPAWSSSDAWSWPFPSADLRALRDELDRSRP
ncbi:MAG: hypothetical protein HOO96_42205 [Polyangiaceae bacterium]|nr:hypothetical protein [Polyangiaceae bacterium]